MAEQATQALAPVEQAPLTVEQRMQQFYLREEAEKNAPEQSPETPAAPPAAEVKQEAETTQEQPTNELTPEDLPEPEASETAPAADDFEIVHNGTQHKLNRADVIKYAQQGFDYTQKTQAVAAQAKQLTEALELSQQLGQIQNALADDMAVIKSFERQLKGYENVDWVAVATNDPLEYPKHRAAFDQMQQGYQRAVAAYQQKAQAVAEGQRKVQATALQSEFARLQELVPEARDPKKFEALTRTIQEYGIKDGYTADELAQVKDARFVRTLKKAALYDQLVAAKQGKVKELRAAPPMAKPGAPSAPSPADKDKDLRAKLRKSGREEDAVALVLSRMK